MNSIINLHDSVISFAIQKISGRASESPVYSYVDDKGDVIWLNRGYLYFGEALWPPSACG